MLLGLVLVALIGLGFLITWLVTRNTSSPQTSTIVITSPTTGTQRVTSTTTSPPRRPATSTVPDVTQQTEEDGANELVHAGLLPSIAFVPAKDPLGTVVAQAWSAGSTLDYHAHMQLNVSSGPGEKPMEAVPNVIGKKLPGAVSTLDGAGLRLIYVRYAATSQREAGTIVQQTPLAGELAPHNGQVLVYVAVES